MHYHMHTVCRHMHTVFCMYIQCTVYGTVRDVCVCGTNSLMHSYYLSNKYTKWVSIQRNTWLCNVRARRVTI